MSPKHQLPALETAYTPGPWEFGLNPKGERTNELAVRPIGQFPHGQWIADRGSPAEDGRTVHARLIAAAPEFLEASKLAIASSPASASWMPVAHTVVAKAAGAAPADGVEAS